MVLPRDERLKAVERMKARVAEVKAKSNPVTEVSPETLTVEEGEAPAE